MHDALDRAVVKEVELLFLQMRLKERESHIKRSEVLEGNQATEDSKLKEEVKRLEGELRS